MVLSSLPPVLVEPLLSGYLPMTALPAVPNIVSPLPSLSDPGYSIKDGAKLDALAHVCTFFESRSLPSNPNLAHWVKWLAKRLVFDENRVLWKIDKAFKLKALEKPLEVLSMLRELHVGFGHRALPAVYQHFRLCYWVPAA